MNNLNQLLIGKVQFSADKNKCKKTYNYIKNKKNAYSSGVLIFYMYFWEPLNSLLQIGYVLLLFLAFNDTKKFF